MHEAGPRRIAGDGRISPTHALPCTPIYILLYLSQCLPDGQVDKFGRPIYIELVGKHQCDALMKVGWRSWKGGGAGISLNQILAGRQEPV